MTETPTGTREAWQLVEGHDDDRNEIAVVVGPKSLAYQIAHEMNVERIEAASDGLGTRKILPVGVLGYPVRAVLPTEPTPAGIEAPNFSPELLDALHSVLWEWQHGEGGHERMRVFQAAPELTRRLDELFNVYGEQVGAVRADDGGAEGQRFLDELAADVDKVRRNYGPRVAAEHAAEDDGDDRGLPIGSSYSGPPRIVANVRMVVRPQDWERHAHGSFGNDADGFATFLADLMQRVTEENPTLSAARVGNAVRIERT